MNSELELVSHLRAHGVKPTTQRLEVSQLLLSSPRHMSADQILSELRMAGSRISKATVYNTLNLFADCNLIREVSVDSERQFYDSTTRPHHHFYNVDTGELIDIEPDDLAFSRLPELPEGTETEDIEVIVRVRNQN
ncbi:MAG: Fur family transcriptional regulator [Gammaproteobacteria bacterium]